jgi:hypothetical protein
MVPLFDDDDPFHPHLVIIFSLFSLHDTFLRSKFQSVSLQDRIREIIFFFAQSRNRPGLTQLRTFFPISLIPEAGTIFILSFLSERIYCTSNMNLMKPISHKFADDPPSSATALIQRTPSTELTERSTSISFLSLLEADNRHTPPQVFSKVIHNLSLMIFYCLSQTHEPNELSDHFNDHEDILQWDLHTIDHFIWLAIEDGQVEYSCLLYGIIYFNRILKSHSPRTNGMQLHLTTGNWRNLLSTCLLLASKMFDDLGMSNEDFRNIFPTTELARVNSFELTLCLYLDFALYVHDKDYHLYRRRYETPNSSRRQSVRAALVYLPPSACHERDDESTSDIIPQLSVALTSGVALPFASSSVSSSSTISVPSVAPTPAITTPPSPESQDLIQHLSFQPLPSSKKSKSFFGTLQEGFQAFMPYVSTRRGRSSPDIKRIYCA